MSERKEHHRSAEVTAFFNGRGKAYADKVGGADKMFRFPYKARLECAVWDIDLDSADILDIGAGSGELYNRVSPMSDGANYYACDLSVVLLESHRASDERKWLGEIFDAPFHGYKWDYIFLIGVVAYLSNESLDRHICYFREHLQERGQVILSITNVEAWSVQIQRLTRRYIPRSWFRSKTIGQSFSTLAMSYMEVEKKFSPLFQVHLKGYIFPRRIPSWLGRKWAPEFVVSFCFLDQLPQIND